MEAWYPLPLSWAAAVAAAEAAVPASSVLHTVNLSLLETRSRCRLAPLCNVAHLVSHRVLRPTTLYCDGHFAQTQTSLDPTEHRDTLLTENNWQPWDLGISYQVYMENFFADRMAQKLFKSVKISENYTYYDWINEWLNEWMNECKLSHF